MNNSVGRMCFWGILAIIANIQSVGMRIYADSAWHAVVGICLSVVLFIAFIIFVKIAWDNDFYDD